MANNFSGDSNCVALYRLESGALATDSKGANTLTNSGVTANTDFSPDGDASGSFDGSSGEYIADSSLSAGYPLKTGDTAKTGTVCFWMKPSNLTNYSTMYCKFDYYGNKGSIDIRIESSKIQVLWVYSGNFALSYSHDTVLVAGQIYHVGLVFDGVAQSLKVRVWDDTAQSVANKTVDDTGWDLQVDDSPMSIGCMRSSGANYNWFTGQLDEVVVFNDLLSDAEIDDIRNGIYGPQYSESSKSDIVRIKDLSSLRLFPSNSSVPDYWVDFTADPCLLATFESNNLMFADNPVASSVQLTQETSIWDNNDPTDQTYPTRTDQTYPNDTDQHVTSDLTTEGYTSYIYYAFGNTVDPTNWTLYTAPFTETMKYLKVRSITVAEDYSVNAPFSLTSLLVMIDMQDFEFDIPGFIISHIEGEDVLYATYGYTMTCNNPMIQASVSYGSNSSSAVSMVPYISQVTDTGFHIELKDIVGIGRTGMVNIHVHGF